VVQEEWDYLRGLLPAKLDELAAETGALRRRRIVASGHDLLRLALAYAVEDWSLRQTAAMAQTLDWHIMSDVAILKRLRACPEFLRRIIAGILERRLEWDYPDTPDWDYPDTPDIQDRAVAPGGCSRDGADDAAATAPAGVHGQLQSGGGGPLPEG
jgi:hypothetical protein